MQKEKIQQTVEETTQKDIFFNRELSWLRFNTRVLNVLLDCKDSLLMVSLKVVLIS